LGVFVGGCLKKPKPADVVTANASKDVFDVFARRKNGNELGTELTKENRLLSAYSAQPGDVYWRDVLQYPPPVGKKLLLLTVGGVAVIGLYTKSGGFVAWSPLPKRIN
jgi:hypothetical protein